MNNQWQAEVGTFVQGDTTQRHRVLRNTYWLLAISLIPTVLGAYIGLKTGIVANLRPGVHDGTGMDGHGHGQ